MTDKINIFIQQLFGAIEKDESITDTLKATLFQLKPVMHSLCQAEPYVITNDKHPARQTVFIAHKLSRLATSNPAFINHFLQIIGDLSTQKASTMNFAGANRKLQDLLDNPPKPTSSHNTEATAQQKRKLTTEEIRAQLNKKIKLCLQGHLIPNQCKFLVLKLWPSALLHIFRKHGDKTNQWNNAIDMYCELLESLQPLNSIDQYRRLKDSYLRIARSNNNMLLLYHEEKNVEPGIKTLISHYNKALGSSNYGQAAENMKKISVLDRISSLPDNVKPGTWCEIFIDEVTPKRRLKLSLINIETGKLIFVNHKGVKKLEKDALEFSEELRRGLSKVYTHSDIFSSRREGDKDRISKIS